RVRRTPGRGNDGEIRWTAGGGGLRRHGKSPGDGSQLQLSGARWTAGVCGIGARADLVRRSAISSPRADGAGEPEQPGPVSTDYSDDRGWADRYVAVDYDADAAVGGPGEVSSIEGRTEFGEGDD